MSDEELENENENDHDHLISLEEESPESEHAYLSTGLGGVSQAIPDMSPALSMNTGTPVNGPSMNGTNMGPPQMIIAQNY